MEILLSKSSMPIIKYIAQLLGWLMNGLYELIDRIGIPNIGIAIILYTIVVYLCMTPLQIKQQKSSKMMSIVQPEISAIQKKYRGKRDQVSQMKMQQEIQSVYSKYGVSMSGNCLPLLIQLPLLFALYQVIYKIPGYISKVYAIFTDLATKLLNTGGIQETLTQFATDNKISNTFSSGVTMTNLTDFLYLLKPTQWTALQSVFSDGQIQSLIQSTAAKSQEVNTFFGINISMSPLDTIKMGASTGKILLVIAAILVPVLAWFSQWLNYKLMPQQVNNASVGDGMQNSMKGMNMIMPIFSAFLCISFSMGIGIYWIAGAAVRCVQQVVINRRLSKLSIEDLIEINRKKQEKKMAKKGYTAQQISQTASKNIKHIDNQRKKVNGNYVDQKEKEAPDYYEKSKNARPDSITARANMVRRYEEKNGKTNGKSGGSNNKKKK